MMCNTSFQRVFGSETEVCSSCPQLNDFMSIISDYEMLRAYVTVTGVLELN